MPSLLDIAPPKLVTRDVEISRGTVTVMGVTGEIWCELYAKYPALKMIVGGRDLEKIDRADGVIGTAALIAAGTGHHNEIEHIRAAVRLLAEDQYKLLQAVIEISYPGEMFLPLAGGEIRGLFASGGDPATKA